MGKNKKKKKNNNIPSSIKKQVEEFADGLEGYVEAVGEIGIFEGKTKESVDHAIKVVMKNVKKLRKGKIDEVFTEEGLEINFGDKL